MERNLALTAVMTAPETKIVTNSVLSINSMYVTKATGMTTTRHQIKSSRYTTAKNDGTLVLSQIVSSSHKIVTRHPA